MQPVPMPDWSWFDAARPASGTGSVRIRLGEVEIGLDGLDESVADKLRAKFGPYVAARASRGALEVAVGTDPREYFIDPPARAELNRIGIDCDGDRVRFVGHRAAGWFPVGAGRGTLVLSRGSFEPAERAVENYVRAAVAWQAAARGGAFVHAASAVRNGRGYLFYGASGAGKSTLAASTRRARIVSDDLSLVLPGPDGRIELVGSPFRGTYEEGEPVVGRFPLAAGFRLIQAPEAEVRPVSRARALAELVGNLPFVAEAFGRRPDLFDGVAQAFRDVPLAHLRFRKDDSYWDAIDRAGL